MPILLEQTGWDLKMQLAYSGVPQVQERLQGPSSTLTRCLCEHSAIYQVRSHLLIIASLPSQLMPFLLSALLIGKSLRPPH